jgi:hypothetical protein
MAFVRLLTAAGNCLLEANPVSEEAKASETETRAAVRTRRIAVRQQVLFSVLASGDKVRKASTTIAVLQKVPEWAGLTR